MAKPYYARLSDYYEDNLEEGTTSATTSLANAAGISPHTARKILRGEAVSHRTARRVADVIPPEIAKYEQILAGAS